jgi:hypothetical protein
MSPPEEIELQDFRLKKEEKETISYSSYLFWSLLHFGFAYPKATLIILTFFFPSLPLKLLPLGSWLSRFLMMNLI